MNRWGALLLAGWLAESLAGPDHNVEAAIEAYRAADYPEALVRLDAAESERGERPELRYNRGLVLAAQGELELARKSFERGTESEEIAVKASSAYELGNLDFDAEDYAAAIERYIECLKADPSHEKAKWNLEVAKQKLEEQKKEQQKNEDENQQGDGDGDQQDGGDGDQEQDGDPSNGDGDGDGDGDQSDSSSESGDGDGDGNQSGGESGDGDGDGDQQPQGDGDQEQDDQQSGDQQKDQQQGDQQQGDQKQGDQQKGDQQKGDQQEGQSQPPQAAPIQRADLSQALEDLDERDNFMLTRPQGGGSKKRVKQDW